MIALSWSRLKTYMECPRKFHLSYISKSFREEEKSLHLIKGEQLHKQLEDYVVAKNGGAAMPLGFTPEVRDTLPYVDRLFNTFASVHPEAQVACDINWKPTDWFAPNVAWRSIWDVVGLQSIQVFIGDWKSGKIYPYGDGFGQLDLSAVMALERWPEVPEVNAAYVYIEHKRIMPIKVTRHPTDTTTVRDGKTVPTPHLAQVKTYFETQFEKVQKEVKWDPTPNDNCKWCQATKAQCQFSRKLG